MVRAGHRRGGVAHGGSACQNVCDRLALGSVSTLGSVLVCTASGRSGRGRGRRGVGRRGCGGASSHCGSAGKNVCNRLTHLHLGAGGSASGLREGKSRACGREVVSKIVAFVMVTRLKKSSDMVMQWMTMRVRESTALSAGQLERRPLCEWCNPATITPQAHTLVTKKTSKKCEDFLRGHLGNVSQINPFKAECRATRVCRKLRLCEAVASCSSFSSGSERTVEWINRDMFNCPASTKLRLQKVACCCLQGILGLTRSWSRRRY